jgi:hypothetical protein
MMVGTAKRCGGTVSFERKAGSGDLVLSEVRGFSGGNMGRAADLQKTQVCATH